MKIRRPVGYQVHAALPRAQSEEHLLADVAGAADRVRFRVGNLGHEIHGGWSRCRRSACSCVRRRRGSAKHAPFELKFTVGSSSKFSRSNPLVLQKLRPAAAALPCVPGCVELPVKPVSELVNEFAAKAAVAPPTREMQRLPVQHLEVALSVIFESLLRNQKQQPPAPIRRWRSGGCCLSPIPPRTGQPLSTGATPRQTRYRSKSTSSVGSRRRGQASPWPRAKASSAREPR